MTLKVFLLLGFSVSLAQDLKPCSTGGYVIVPGECKKLVECQSSLSNMRAGINPTSCFEAGGLLSVCCQKKRISEIKCEQYEAQVGTLVSLVKTDSSEMCFQASAQAQKRQVDWMDLMSFTAAIGYENNKKLSWKCSGTLISTQFVLTAASCFNSQENPQQTKVVLGVRMLQNNYMVGGKHTDSRVEVGVSEILTHPDYSPPKVYNDVALIKLERAVKFTPNIQPACLPRPEGRPEAVDRFLVAGWGGMPLTGDAERPLEIAEVTKYSRKECDLMVNLLKGNSTELPESIVKSQICAADNNGEEESSGETCVGDRGGPLAATKGPSNCVQYVLGVTSYGTEMCRYGGMPVVYTNVQSYLDWIESVVWAEKEVVEEVEEEEEEDLLAMVI